MVRPDVSEDVLKRLDDLTGRMFRVDAAKVSTEEKLKALMDEYEDCRDELSEIRAEKSNQRVVQQTSKERTRHGQNDSIDYSDI